MRLDARALDHALGRDEHERLVRADDERRGEAAALLGELDRLHALRAARRQAVLGDRRALAEAALGDDEDLLLVARDVHREDDVALAGDVHAADAGGVAAHRRGRRPRWKRTARPALEIMRISSSPLVRRTATSSSSSRILIAMMPSALIGVL